LHSVLASKGSAAQAKGLCLGRRPFAASLLGKSHSDAFLARHILSHIANL